jgi:hypothetical protein
MIRIKKMSSEILGKEKSEDYMSEMNNKRF